MRFNLPFNLLVTAVTAGFFTSGCGYLRDKIKPKNKDKNNPPTSAVISTATGTGISPDPSTKLGKGGPQPSPLQLTGGLRSFESCAAVEEHIEARMVADMQQMILQQIEWLEASDDQPVYGPMVSASQAGAMEKSASNDSAATTAGDGAGGTAGPQDVTKTNNQVEGVEESDFVKNTGQYIFHVSHGKLRILKSWPADSLTLLSETAIAGRPFEMIFDEDNNRLVIFGNPKFDPSTQVEEGAGGSSPAIEKISPMPPFGDAVDPERVEVLVMDVTDASAPVIRETYRLKGSFHNARRIGNSVRVILKSYRGLPPEVTYWVDESASYDQFGNYIPAPKDQQIAALKALMAKNEEIIRSQPLSWWLEMDDFIKLDRRGRQSPALDLGDCRQVHAPTVETNFGLTRIASLDLEQASLSENLLLSDVDAIYASKSSLYLSTPYYWWDTQSRDTDYTYIHKFDISTPGVASYLGSGGVEGTLINQFAMDEYDDHLRVATTVVRYCSGGMVMTSTSIAVSSSPVMALTQEECPPPNELMFNQVAVLATANGVLKQVGKTKPMAPNERIYSVRFAEKRGFVVTFRQVDPLFTLDLSDPSQPSIVGELKVPGYSSYIHMIDDNTLLTIGRDATLTGQVLGLKLSIFDVSNMAKPSELQTLTLKGQFWSEAEYNHKAFTYFPAKGTLAIPVTGYRETKVGNTWWGQYLSALKVFKIDPANGISEVGEIDMTNIHRGTTRRQADWWFSGATVQRSIFADDYVYAIADFGIQAAKLDALEQPVGGVSYQCDDSCYQQWWAL